MSDGIVERNACPACRAASGEPCETRIDGVDVGWTHDARVYADLGVAGVLGLNDS